MKTGAGDDPFAMDDDDSDENAEPSVDETSGSNTPGERGRDLDATPEPADDETPDEPADGSDESLTRDEIPWVLRRSAVKEDRDNVHQFFLRDEYATREDELRDEVAELLDVRTKEVKKLDLREAMYAVVDAEDIAEELRAWGYEYVD